MFVTVCCNGQWTNAETLVCWQIDDNHYGHCNAQLFLLSLTQAISYCIRFMLHHLNDLNAFGKSTHFTLVLARIGIQFDLSWGTECSYWLSISAVFEKEKSKHNRLAQSSQTDPNFGSQPVTTHNQLCPSFFANIFLSDAEPK